MLINMDAHGMHGRVSMQLLVKLKRIRMLVVVPIHDKLVLVKLILNVFVMLTRMVAHGTSGCVNQLLDEVIYHV